jgi:hypothetical protein
MQLIDFRKENKMEMEKTKKRFFGPLILFFIQIEMNIFNNLVVSSLRNEYNYNIYLFSIVSDSELIIDDSKPDIQ